MTDVVELASQLVAVPSVSPMRAPRPEDPPCEEAVTAFLLDWFTRRRIACAAVEAIGGRQSVIACVPGATDRPTLVFDAHQDTVPPDPAAVSPFRPRIEGGKLYGRGACDVKGPMASMLVAVERVSRLSHDQRPTLVFIGTCDEEFGQAGAIDVVRRWTTQQFPFKVPKPDAVIVAEPTELHPVVAHNGVLRWTITTRGRAAHSSSPEKGDSAIYRMARVIAAWEKHAEHLEHSGLLHPRCGRPRTSIGRVEGGTAVNVVPDRCWIEIDRRMVPGERVSDVWVETHRLLTELDDADVHCSEAWTESLPLLDRDNGELALAVAEEVRALGRRSEPGGVPFGTHAPRYAEMGCPVIVFGPGSIAQAHTADEWIEVEPLEIAAEALTRFATNWTRTSSNESTVSET